MLPDRRANPVRFPVNWIGPSTSSRSRNVNCVPSGPKPRRLAHSFFTAQRDPDGRQVTALQALTFIETQETHVFHALMIMIKV